MKRNYTVIWDRGARDQLGDLWLDNPAIRKEITDAVHGLDVELAQTPEGLGQPASGGAAARYVVRPPIAIVFVVLPDDRQVRVTKCRFWDDD
jgi:hypothetical protein